MPKLMEFAKVVRSKNAGPFVITFDIMFSNRETYDEVKATGVISAKLFAKLYNVAEEVCEFNEYDTASAFKCSIPRLIPSGDIGDSDVYGAQQQAPLLDVEIPIDV